MAFGEIGVVPPDYTSRDYVSLRSSMIDVARTRLPAWTGDDPSDFGLALIEAFAHAADGLHYYLDRVAGEAFLGSATQPARIRSIARLLGYRPGSAFPARVTLRFTSTLSGVKTTIPAGTRCQSVVKVTGGEAAGGVDRVLWFETVSPVTIDNTLATPQQTVEVEAVEGVSVFGEVIGTSSGLAGQMFPMRQLPVISGSVSVFSEMLDGSGNVVSTDEWALADSVHSGSPDSRLFSLFRGSDGRSWVRFGDGATAAVPQMHARIRAYYRVGGGAMGNLAENTIRIVASIPNGDVPVGLTVTNPARATGGTDEEGVESIRENAPVYLRGGNRAVTLSDFESLALSVYGVEKAGVWAKSGASVHVYVAPGRDSTATPGRNSDGTTTTLMNSIVEAASSVLEERAMAGTTITVVPVAYTKVYLGLTLHRLPGIAATEDDNIIRAARNAVRAYLSHDTATFGEVLAPQFVMSALVGIPGVSHITLKRLTDKSSEMTLVSDVRAPEGRLLYIDPENTSMLDVKVEAAPASTFVRQGQR